MEALFFVILFAVLAPELKKRAGQRRSRGPAVYRPGRPARGTVPVDTGMSGRILAGGAVGIGGALLAGLMGLVAISTAGSEAWMLGMGLDYLMEYLAQVGVFALMAAGCWMGSRWGFRLLDRAKRCSLYKTIIAGRDSVPLRELAMASGQSEEALRSDLMEMVRRGYLPQAIVDEEAGCYYASSAVWNAAPHQPEEPVRPAGVAEDVAQFIRELDAEAAHIDEEPVSARLDAIRIRAQSILDWLETHPEAEDDVRRFSNYYLPTTLKLVRAYNDVDPHAARSGAAAQVQQQVARVLATVEEAFGNLLDTLIGHEAVDVSAEISALETVLAQDGLSGGGLHAGTRQ